MQGRRNNQRFRIDEAGGGVLQALCDVLVQRIDDTEWIAISRQPAVVGEMLLLDIVEGEPEQRLTVCVIESRPVVLDGDMRHRIRLQTEGPQPILFEQQLRRG